jgi:hypothetical protein
MTQKKTMAGTVSAALAMLCCCGSAFAGGAGGTSAYQFLQLGVGARPAAMGGAFVGVSGDVNAMSWNPAGLVHVERAELSLTHAVWLQGIAYSNIAYGRPALGGTIGAVINRLSSGDIQKVDNTGLRLAESYTMSDTMGLVSYARRRGSWALGANLKYISSHIEEENANSYAADVGVLYSGFRLWGRKFRLGLSMQNVGTAAKYVDEDEPLPVITRAGCYFEPFKGLSLVSDLNYMDRYASIHAGAEYARPIGVLVLAARAGYKNDTVRKLGALSRLTAGIGLEWGDYQLDYAWNSFTDLGITHRISLGIKFGDPGVMKEPPAAVPEITKVST